MVYRLCILVIFVSTSLSLRAQSREATGLERIEPSAFHRQQIDRDRPFSDYLIQAEKGQLWIAGREFIWQWNFIEQRLQRLKLPIATSAKLSQYRKFLALNESGLLLATDEQLFLISSDPLQIFEFRSPTPNLSVTMGLSFQETDGDSNLLWVKSDGVYRINAKTREVNDVHKFEIRIDAAKQALVNGDLVWLQYDEKLETYNLKTNELKTVLQSKQPIEALQADENGDIFALTSQGIVRFAEDSSIIQILPVEIPATPIAAAFNRQRHTYLFSDRYVEVYDLSQRESFLYRTSLPTQNRSAMIQQDGTLFVFGNHENFELWIL